ncbi:hypothetical protein OAQ99_01810 [Candidatus Kapabacteria bacterium]|nr:hypothetical protein [Candidatus Kapabacteria bacterium]
MKKILLSLFIPLIILAQTAQFDYFKAKSIGEDVVLEWSMKDEIDISHFMIQKKIVNGDSGTFVYITSKIDTKGNGKYYVHTDEDSFYSKQTKERLNSEAVKSYRIEATTKSGDKIYSDETFVTHNVSSVRKTWGMLKEMFR